MDTAPRGLGCNRCFFSPPTSHCRTLPDVYGERAHTRDLLRFSACIRCSQRQDTDLGPPSDVTGIVAPIPSRKHVTHSSTENKHSPRLTQRARGTHICRRATCTSPCVFGREPTHGNRHHWLIVHRQNACVRVCPRRLHLSSHTHLFDNIMMAPAQMQESTSTTPAVYCNANIPQTRESTTPHWLFPCLMCYVSVSGSGRLPSLESVS
jgi:hypothetical protein